ncbi:MAG: radical SAM protein, partial [Candidatus Zixiibacteriota bacterium]
MSFRQLLDRTDRESLHRRVLDTTPEAVERALAAPAVSFSGFLALISPAARNYLEPMARRARSLTARRFGRVVLLYAPLYLSNECTNACLYCGFNVHRTVPRITLKSNKITAEANYLTKAGFKHLLLVCGEAPQAVPVPRLAEALNALRKDFPSLSLEVYPLSEEEYRQVAAAGADGLTLYQETYDREVYARVHPAGRKRDYDWRLEAAERAGRADFRRLNVGALLGLADWRREAVAVALHADYLMKTFWRAQVAVSFPRLRHTPEGFQPPAPVSDAGLTQMLMALRLFLPDAG